MHMLMKPTSGFIVGVTIGTIIFVMLCVLGCCFVCNPAFKNFITGKKSLSSQQDNVTTENVPVGYPDSSPASKA